MTGPEHYQAAEFQLDMASDADDYGSDKERYHLAKAQVHATLAATAAIADLFALDGTAGEASAASWRDVLSAHPPAEVTP